MKRTKYYTLDRGKDYRVYQDDDGRLYYRKGGFWKGTFPCYCSIDWDAFLKENYDLTMDRFQKLDADRQQDIVDEYNEAVTLFQKG